MTSRLRTRLTWALRLFFAVALVVGLVLLVRRIGLRTLGHVIASANPGWLALAILCKASAASVATWRFHRLARPWVRLTLRRVVNVVWASYATNHMFGAGLSAAYRVYGLAREGASAGASVTVVAVEKYLELVAFVVVLLPLALALGTPPALRWTFWVWAGAAGGCLLVAGAALIIARLGRSGVLARMARGLAALRQEGNLRVAIAQTFVYMSLETLILYAAANAAGAHIGLGAALFGFLGAELGFLIPGPPSSIGALEAGIAITLEATGVDSSHALAAALLYHAIHVIVEMPVGVPCLRSAAWRPWRTAPAAEPDQPRAAAARS
ncbi:MAG TPA: lysylphosphatidylglycerol synthase transmembrane domain-containing protein [Polyangia bacterium]